MPQVPLEIGVHEVRALQTDGIPFLLLDCRQLSEHQVANIAGAELIPMNDLPARLNELEAYRSGQVVVHCHHGGRSLRVVQWLREQGFTSAQSMAGGIDLWSQEIDTSVPRY